MLTYDDAERMMSDAAGCHPVQSGNAPMIDGHHVCGAVVLSIERATYTCITPTTPGALCDSHETLRLKKLHEPEECERHRREAERKADDDRENSVAKEAYNAIDKRISCACHCGARPHEYCRDERGSYGVHSDRGEVTA